MILPHVRDVAARYKSKVIFLRVEEEPVKLGWDGVIIGQKKYHAEFEERRKLAESYLAALGIRD
jgi:hypothetical protein